MSYLQRKMFANGNAANSPAINLQQLAAYYSSQGYDTAEIFDLLGDRLTYSEIENIATAVGGSVNPGTPGVPNEMRNYRFQIFPEVDNRLPPADPSLDPRLGPYAQQGKYLNPPETLRPNDIIWSEILDPNVEDFSEDLQGLNDDDISVEEVAEGGEEVKEGVEALMGPNDIQLSDGRIINWSKGIKDIQEGRGQGIRLYRLFNTDSIKRGENVDKALKEFIEKDEPGYFKMWGGSKTLDERRGSPWSTPEDFGSAFWGAGRGVRDVLGEVAEKTLPGPVGFFGGEGAAERTRDFFEKDRFDPNYTARGGLDPEEIDILALQTAGVSSSDLNEIENALEEIKPAETKVNIDKTEVDTEADVEDKFAGLDQDEFIEELEPKLPSLPDLIGEEDEDGIEDGIEEDSAIETSIEGDPVISTSIEENRRIIVGDPVTRKLEEPGFFGSDRFLDFIRNVGGELTRTGQMGAGLSLGASKAAEERAARELMAEQEERDYQSKLRLAKAEAALAGTELTGSDVVKYVEFEDEIGTALKNFDEDERILSDINQVLNEDVNAPGAFDAQGLFGQWRDKLRNAAGYGEKEWENLPAEVRTKAILDITAQRSVRSILGESGKTISNLDRQIVAQIFGQVTVFTSPAELKKILGNSRASIIEGLRSSQNLIISRATALNRVGYTSPILNVNQSLIKRILDFNFADVENYRLGKNAAGYTEITL